ncbi:MAG: diguanylate cyclase [Chloroflexi bacterium]|nr:diguanylate cyclase [Chloroflexota bacterium]
MNIYALIPLVAVAAYIPLLITTISSHPWRQQHKLFAVFLIAAILWSFSDLLLRGLSFPQHSLLLAKLVVIMYTWMTVQFHCFTSSFFSPGEGRWLPFAYASLAVAVAAIGLGYVAEDVIISGDKLSPVYGPGLLFVVVPLLTLLARNIYVFWRKLRVLNNPVIYNQIASLMLALAVLTISSFAAIIPWGRELPLIHLGSIINAFVLSYATISHRLVDIRSVLRRGLAMVSLWVIGIASYVLLLISLHTLAGFELDFSVILGASSITVLVIASIYKLRGYLFATVNKALQGQSYDYRQQLSEFANKIHNVFSLEEQGGELLALLTRALDCKQAGLLFREVGSDDFSAKFVEPREKDNPLSGLRLHGQSPVVQYLEREQKIVTRESLTILPEFRSLWEQEKWEIKSKGIELFVPLISREKMISILVLDKKQRGRYTLEDLGLLQDVTNRVAVSMEKEYLREKLREREEELSAINRCSTIITSSLNIREIYDSFISELKQVVDVSWAAIALIEEDSLYFLALSSEIGSAWKVGDRIPIKGTATEWVAANKRTVVEPDLMQESRFATAEYYIKQGVRSIVYLPLIAKGKAIGTLTVASRHPNAYSQRQMALLEQLAAQIAMPVENSRLYATVEERARIDELTGLLNRRSLDEIIASEIHRHSRYGGAFSLVVLDLDFFKNFNDNYGHLAGDKLLRKIGGIMKSSIRSADQAFRYGGDEFAILLPQTSVEAAYEVAERVRQRIASAKESASIPVTASLGLASWPVDGIGAHQLIAAADAALYQAKRSGGNQSHRVSGVTLSWEDIIDGSDTQESEIMGIVYALAATVDAKDHYTYGHSKKVSDYAVVLAEALGMEPSIVKRLETCALLHDIGKITISEEILNKRDKLTDEEWKTIKRHPQLGATITSHARRLSPCLPGILHHHEKYDGGGYPHGLKGEEIPLEARILSIADAFAAMTSDRAYSEALTADGALEEIKSGAGKQFDPHLVETFLAALKTSPVTVREDLRR